MSLQPPSTKNLGYTCLVLAWALSLLATLASLFIGEVMGMTPCNLCWYQRAMMFPLPIVLWFAVYENHNTTVKAAFAVAFVGAGVALFHSLFYAGLIPRSIQPCGAGPSCADDKLELFSLVIPYLSLASFLAILLLLACALRGRESR